MVLQLLNSPPNAADEALVGLLAAQPRLSRLEGHRVVIRRDLGEWRRQGRPALVSAAASGHGHYPAKLVGVGLLTAAALGDLMTPPAADTIVAAVRATATQTGVLVVAMDYPTDRRHCGVAAQRLLAEGVRVELLFVDDDYGVGAVGRGHAGIVLMCKILGGAAETPGLTVDDLAAIGRQVIAGLSTIAVALTPRSRPDDRHTANITNCTMDLGVGVRDENGTACVPACTSKKVMKLMLDHLTRAGAPRPLQLPSQCVLLVNSLGGLSEIELLVATRDAMQELNSRGVSICRLVSGALLTSLAKSSVSITVLSLQDGHVTGQLLLHWLDTLAVGWSNIVQSHSCLMSQQLLGYPLAPAEGQITEDDGPLLSTSDGRRVARCLDFAARALVACAGQLNELDRGAGDGDCGTTLSSLGRLVLQRLASMSTDRPRRLFTELADVCETIGGTSGILYALAVAAASRGWPRTGGWPWLAALRDGLDAVQQYGGARLGDRTLLDAAEPALLAAEQAAAVQGEGQTAGRVALAAAEAAERGAMRTASMTAGAGRASYVSKDLLTRADPGAHAVAVWIRAVAEALKLG